VSIACTAWEDQTHYNLHVRLCGVFGLRYLATSTCTLAIVIAAVAWPAGYAPIGSGPDSYEEAALAWNATSSSPPPADLAYCEYDISFMAFLGPIFILAFGALALVVGCLMALEWLDKKEKAAKKAEISLASAPAP
jgi:hypothetical protein